MKLQLQVFLRMFCTRRLMTYNIYALHQYSNLLTSYNERYSPIVAFLCTQSQLMVVLQVKNKMQQVLSYLDMLLNPQSVSEAKATSTAELLTYYNSNVKNFLDVLHHVDDNMCRNFFIKYKTAVFKSEADISSMFMEWIESTCTWAVNTKSRHF